MQIVKPGTRSPVQRVPALAAAIFASLVIVLTFAKFANEPLLEGDLSTYVLPADFLLRHDSVIYVDLFDIKPPVTYLIFVPWVALFGTTLIGLWVYYTLWLAILFWITWLVLRQFITGWFALVPFFTLGATLVAFGMLEEILFITEVVGLALVMAALYLLVRRPGTWTTYAGVGALTIVAGQTKEVFILTPLIALPAFLLERDQRGRHLAAFIAGGASALALLIAALAWWSPRAIGEYVNILSFKSQRFPPPDLAAVAERTAEVIQAIHSWLPLFTIFLLTLVALLVWQRMAMTEKQEAPSHRYTRIRNAWITTTFALAVLAAFIWQGAPPLVHYAVALVFPLIVLISLLMGRGIEAALAIQSPSLKFGVIIVLLLGILPAASSALWIAGRTTGLNVASLAGDIQELESPEVKRTYDRISQLTDPDNCIQVAYGWAASAAYLYSEREPCSRFIVPPLALDEMRINELQQDLITSPPSLLVIDPRLSAESTYPSALGDPDSFVFPFRAVAESCYSPIDGEPTVFEPRSEDATVMSECIEREVGAMLALNAWDS